MNVQHPDPDRLAMAALPAEPPDPAVTAHLQGCETCLDQVVALRSTVELARAGGADSGLGLEPPPPAVWQAIVDELGSGAGAPAREPEPRPAAPPAPPAVTPLPRRAPRWRTTALVAAALALGIVGGIGIGAGIGAGGAPRTPTTTPLATLAPLGPAGPGATGTVAAVQGDGERQLVVRLAGVTDTAGADYLEAWLMDPLGTRLVSLGALTRDAEGGYVGEFTVPADLPVTEFGVVDVSAERWDGDERHSRTSLLRGALA